MKPWYIRRHHSFPIISSLALAGEAMKDPALEVLLWAGSVLVAGSVSTPPKPHKVERGTIPLLLIGNSWISEQKAKLPFACRPVACWITAPLSQSLGWRRGCSEEACPVVYSPQVVPTHEMSESSSSWAVLACLRAALSCWTKSDSMLPGILGKQYNVTARYRLRNK